MRKRMVVVVFDQGWQVWEGQVTVQVGAAILMEDRHSRTLEFLHFVRHCLINVMTWLQVAGPTSLNSR